MKEFLSENHLKYKEIIVGEKSAALEIMQQKFNYSRVPITFIEEEMVVGFEKEKIEELLELNNSD